MAAGAPTPAHELTPASGRLVAEQTQRGFFNEGALLNRGFQVGADDYACTYFVFTDIDQLPGSLENTFANFAEHFRAPVHICTNMTQFSNSIPYPDFGGGGVMLTAAQYRAINGHSSMMQGWSKEDDNLVVRILHKFKRLHSLPPHVGVCINLEHPRYTPVKVKSDRIASPAIRQVASGVNLNRLIFHYQRIVLASKSLDVSKDFRTRAEAMALGLNLDNATALREMGILPPQEDGLSNLDAVTRRVATVEKSYRMERFLVEMTKHGLPEGEPC
jgi:hypothetical protein